MSILTVYERNYQDSLDFDKDDFFKFQTINFLNQFDE